MGHPYRKRFLGFPLIIRAWCLCLSSRSFARASGWCFISSSQASAASEKWREHADKGLHLTLHFISHILPRDEIVPFPSMAAQFKISPSDIVQMWLLAANFYQISGASIKFLRKMNVPSAAALEESMKRSRSYNNDVFLPFCLDLTLICGERGLPKFFEYITKPAHNRHCKDCKDELPLKITQRLILEHICQKAKVPPKYEKGWKDEWPLL